MADKQLLDALDEIIGVFDKEAKLPCPDLEPEDELSVQAMNMGDANDYREIKNLVEQGDLSLAIDKQQNLDTAPRNAIYYQDEPHSSVLVEYFT